MAKTQKKATQEKKSQEPTTKEVNQSQSPKEGEIPEMKPGEVLTPEKDLAVKAAAGEQLGENKPNPISDDKESHEKLEEHQEEVIDKLNTDPVQITGSNPQYDAAVAQKPMVPDPISGRPVYETSEQARIAEAMKGNLYTEDPEK